MSVYVRRTCALHGDWDHELDTMNPTCPHCAAMNTARIVALEAALKAAEEIVNKVRRDLQYGDSQHAVVKDLLWSKIAAFDAALLETKK